MIASPEAITDAAFLVNPVGVYIVYLCSFLIGLAVVAPGQLLRWKKRLTERGVMAAGPMRAGPPGQASLYFNDPFGNHLELVTIGFVDEELPIGMPDRSQLDYIWKPVR